MAVREIYDPVREELALVAARVSGLAASAPGPLGEAAAGLALRPGKMLRPALLLLSAAAGRPIGGPPAPPHHRDRLVAAAAAFELLHLASLTHDDIVDASTLRRGAPSVWGRWGAGVAVLTGDHFYGKAVGQASLAGRRASRSLCRTIDALLAGEALELTATGGPGGRPPASPMGRRSYLALATAKTAVFCAEACALGARLGRAAPGAVRALGGYGKALGQAYQLTDDLLDWLGDPDRMGKPGLADLARGVLNYPVIAGLNRRPASIGKALAALRAAGSPEAATAILGDLTRRLGEAGAFEETRRHVRATTARAGSFLAALPPGPARDSLERLLERLEVREA